MDPIIGILIRYVIIPEVSRILANHHAKNTGTTLTDAEILAKLPADVQQAIGVGQAFLDRTRTEV